MIKLGFNQPPTSGECPRPDLKRFTVENNQCEANNHCVT